MISRFLSVTTAVALSLVLIGQALAYDPTRAPGYGSPDMYRPNMDGVILRGNSSSGLANGLSVKIPDDAAAARTLADMARDRPSVKSFGSDPSVVCNGTNDDTAAFDKAAATGKQIFVPAAGCRVSHFTIPSSGGSFIGAGRGGTSTIKLTTPAGVDAITVTGPGGFLAQPGNWTTVFRDLTFDATGNTAMTGRAIACQNAAGVVLERVQFKGVPNLVYEKDCTALTAIDIHAEDLAPATGVGFDFDGGSFFGDRIYYTSTKPGGLPLEPEAFFKVRQTYGFYLGLGVVSHVRRGLYVVPGAGQFAEYSTVGGFQFDQCSLACTELLASGGTIRGWQFNGMWSSTAANAVYLHSNGGSIFDIELNQVRAVNSLNSNLVANDVAGLKIISGDYSSAGYRYTGSCDTTSDGTFTIKSGFEVNTVFAGQTIVINGVNYTVGNILTNVKARLTPAPPTQTGVACSFTSPAATNISLGGATSGVQIVGTKAGRSSASRASPQIGLFIDANVDNVFVNETDFSGVPLPAVWNRTTPMTEAAFTGNRGLDTKQTTIASAATLPLTFARVFTLTGTTTVTAISGPAWPQRQVTFIPTGVVTFTAGNNIGNGFTTVGGQPVLMTLQEGKWFLK